VKIKGDPTVGGVEIKNHMCLQFWRDRTPKEKAIVAEIEKRKAAEAARKAKKPGKKKK
jgi:hypothetical protein